MQRGFVGGVRNFASTVRCEASYLVEIELFFFIFCKQWWSLTASHLTEQSECVSWWPGCFSDRGLISISADLPELTGVIVATEYLPHRMKTYSFIKSQWIASLELYVCSGLFPELPADNHWLPPNYESMAMCQVTDIWMASSLTVWCQHLCLALTESQLWWIWHCSSLTLLLPLRGP